MRRTLEQKEDRKTNKNKTPLAVQHTFDTPDEVRTRIVAIMQQWGVSLVNENKCKDAYHMLIKQGIPAPTETRTDCIHVAATDACVATIVLGFFLLC
jgi:hypothetical protein